MDRSIYWNRIAKVRSLFSKKGLDSVWILGPENRRYISGFRAQDTHITESSGSVLIGKEYVIIMTDPRYELEAYRDSPDFEIKIFKDNPIKDICKIMIDSGVKRVGFDEDYITWGLFHRLKQEFFEMKYDIEFVPLGHFLEEIRQIKDEHEISLIKRSAHIICNIMDQIVESVEAGVTEKDLAFKMQELAYKTEAEGLSFPPIVASGPNSALPHAVPTDKKILPREPVIIDIGVKFDGYCSDITRTVFVECPDQEFKKIYSIIEKAQLLAIETVKPGIKASELDSIAREFIVKSGYGKYFTHGLGHGIGLFVHERPRVSKTDPTVLMPGMVITVEPGIYIPNKGGVRLEEMVLIKEDGCEVITKG